MQKINDLKEIETAVNKYRKIVVCKKDNNLIAISMEEYKKELLEKDIEEHILKSEEDMKNGRVRRAEDVFKEWKEKYGI